MRETVVSVLVALALAACGGGGGGDNGPAVASTGSGGAAPSAPAPSPATLLVQRASTVNTTTAGQQTSATVWAQDDGGYIVVWTSDGATVFTQRYDSAGNKVGSETALADVPPPGARASLLVRPDGEIVVASATAPPDGAQAISIAGYDAGGVLIGAAEVASILPSPTTGRAIDQIALVPLADGGFALGWSVFDLADGWTMFTLRLDSDAAPIGDPVQLPGSFPKFPFIRLNPDVGGGYTMQVGRTVPPGAAGDPFGGSLSELQALFHFDANGTALEVVKPGPIDALLIPLADGRFVAFTRAAGDLANPPRDWSRQFLDSAANPVGNPVAVPSDPVAASALADGSFIVFFMDIGSTAISAQHFDANGAPLGAAVALAAVGVPAASGSPSPRFPGVSILVNGNLALAWPATSAGGDSDVFTQQVLVQK